VEKERRDEHGNVKKKKYLVDVYPTTGGKPTPGRRHRVISILDTSYVGLVS
jgi:hypothetical protein